MSVSESQAPRPQDGPSPARQPLLALAAEHLERATLGVVSGRFSAFKELQDPRQMLVIYRKRYGGDVVGDEYFVAQPTYITGQRARLLRPGETIVLDFEGEPAIALVEGLLYRRLLQGDRAAQTLVSRHLAHHS